MNTAFLWDLLSQPTAPFRESLVRARVIQELKSASVPHFIDPAGNLVVGPKSQAEYRKLTRVRTQEPLRLFIAHMDHPGFHGVQWVTQERLEVRWHGGTPTSHLEGASVWIGNDRGFTHLQGTLASFSIHSSGRAIERAEIVFANPEAKSEFPDASSLFGGFRFRAPVWQEGARLYTKAADDLVGVFTIVSTAVEIFTNPKLRKIRPHFIGLLTRAEEVGFIGTIEHFKLGWVQKSKRPVLTVSLETSRTLPGAEFGKGPVVRLGDRSTVFDPGALKVLTDLATEVLPGRHQRRIMDGGSCEATASTAFGVPAIGISVPLGNYHNQGFEGGPDCLGPSGPAPEFVDLSDVSGMLDLCKGLMKVGLPWNDPWKKRVAEFKKSAADYKALMKERRA